MKIRYSIIILSLLAGLSLIGCSKGYGPRDMTFRMTVGIQATSLSDTLYQGGWTGYSFYPGTDFTYQVASYEDAEQGIVRAVEGDNAVYYDQQFEMDDNGVIRFTHLNRDPAILLMVYPKDSLYAWREVQVVDGLDSITSRIVIPRYREDSMVTLYSWNVILKYKMTKDPNAEPTANYTVIPNVRETEGGESSRSTGWIGYYYVVDRDDYQVLSFEDAQARVLTPMGGGEGPTGESVTATTATAGDVRFEKIEEGAVLLVMYQQESKAYAYRYLEVTDVSADIPTTWLYFNLYDPGKTAYAGWTMVVPEPAEEPDPEDPDPEDPEQ